MPLRLTITSYHKLTPGQRPDAELDRGELRIGRGTENDWVLPDPERLVSSQHCTIQSRDGVYYLTDTSTNGVMLAQSGIRLRRGNSERLNDGEVLKLGEYEILVQITAPATSQPFSSSSAAAPSVGGADPFSSFDALMNRQVASSAIPEPYTAPSATQMPMGGSPLDTKPDLFDFLNPAPPPAAAIPDHVPAERHDFRPPTPVVPPAPPLPSVTPPPAAAAEAHAIPADWDPFADLGLSTPSAAPSIPVPMPAAATPQVPEPAPAQLPEDFFAGIGAPASDAQATSVPPPQAAAQPDPMAMLFGSTPFEPGPQTEAPMAEPVEVSGAPALTPAAQATHAAIATPPAEPVAVAMPVPTPPAATPPPVAAQAPQGELLEAFLRGAGLSQLRIDHAEAAAQMEAIGRSYRLMVDGLVDVLRARSSLKGEFRMSQTMIRPVENNPLKFAPNADEALLLLLRHGNAAFMPPDQAVKESFDDVKAHQLAVMAGVQAAIKHLLKRFEPAALEARLSKPSGLSALLPGSRQSQYWELFTDLYASISREAEDDFQDLFGREFSRAYEEHSARLRGG
ncbi:type VI secretion system-associated FHA domain protein TagH [Pseudomonas sp. ENNP23]|uniref:type VI secretion system-associated FHA domain protein TagH n=1 Tax=Pseudomonas sp. ENNP23 TaxID=1535636 RepID=UPI00084AFBF0|nr:type VI secretion system-associated FHA domain protein TagH [Pseudomonas sp. ENNP23]OEC51988.1 FHA domain-containing protein [Pseudomonas sp. ENNP23]